MEVTFRVDHLPIGRPEPQIVMYGRSPRAYTPKDHPVHSFKEALRLEALHATRQDESWPLDCGVILTIDLYFPRTSDKKWKLREMPQDWKIKKPDWDNVAKAVCDALEGILWTNDSRVCSGTVNKYMVRAETVDDQYREERPGVVITAKAATDGPI